MRPGRHNVGNHGLQILERYRNSPTVIQMKKLRSGTLESSPEVTQLVMAEPRQDSRAFPPRERSAPWQEGQHSSAFGPVTPCRAMDTHLGGQDVWGRPCLFAGNSQPGVSNSSRRYLKYMRRGGIPRKGTDSGLPASPCSGVTWEAQDPLSLLPLPPKKPMACAEMGSLL